MIVPLFAFLASFSAPQPAPQPVVPLFVVSVLDERVGDDVLVRFVLSGPPGSYSATREGNEVLVRIAAEALPGMSIPASADPISSLVLGPKPGFSFRVTLTENRSHEIVREVLSLKLVFRKRVEALAPAPAVEPSAATAPVPTPSPQALAVSPNAPAGEPVEVDTADLYRRLFPVSTDPGGMATAKTEIGAKENWYSNFKWLGLQLRPWVSVSYVSGESTQLESNTVSADSYWVVQPNLGLGFSPHFGREGEDGGAQWKVNYTPRFRRLVNVTLPRLTSHFFDAGVDQPVASLGSIYGTYHYSKGVLETEEVDPGREYGIGRNRVIDTSLERFQRHTLGVGVRFDFVADTQVDVNANKTSVRYGKVEEDAEFLFGERAFFDYDARTLNASVRRGLGVSRFLSFLFGVHDTPNQKERKEVEGRGYSYEAAVEGDVAALITGRVLLGYRTQKNPNAGAGGQDYKDLTYGAQLLRDISEDTKLGLTADRKLHLSAYEGNGFYVNDSIKADLNTRLPLAVFLRGSFGIQSNGYKTSPQVNDAVSAPVLRTDKIRTWTIGLSRSFAEWGYLRADYTSEYRNSNLDRFDLKSRAFTVQLGLGFFGKPGSRAQPSW